MRWEGERESSNVEDDRGGGGGGGFGLGGRSIGIGTIVIALVGGAIFGINPLTILSLLSGGPAPVQQQAPRQQNPKAEDRDSKFVRVVLANTEDVWSQVFSKGGATYQPSHLVMYTGGIRTGCGAGQAAMGPFYCPADSKVYIDLGFYRTLRDQLGAPGEFAQAYVIAHEVGHHVQKLLGISARMDAQRSRVSETEYNQLSVRLELQADFFAGVWAHYAQQRGLLEVGDIEEALTAATAIGDDRLQRETQGYVVPDSFTHGTSEQRVRWFRKGYETGDIKQGETFSARSL